MPGDAILAATEDGVRTIDTVSVLSISSSDIVASFVTLTAGADLHLAITPTHHLPVGDTCCSMLKQAADVRLGDTLWTMEADGGAAVGRVVTNVGTTYSKGLHSPVLTHGHLPLVDGFVTSFNSIHIVRLRSPHRRVLGPAPMHAQPMSCAFLWQVRFASYFLPLCEGSGICAVWHHLRSGD